jgi:hypothetical protein
MLPSLVLIRIALMEVNWLAKPCGDVGVRSRW